MVVTLPKVISTNMRTSSIFAYLQLHHESWAHVSTATSSNHYILILVSKPLICSHTHKNSALAKSLLKVERQGYSRIIWQRLHSKEVAAEYAFTCITKFREECWNYHQISPAGEHNHLANLSKLGIVFATHRC